jgi:hypothetical protein
MAWQNPGPAVLRKADALRFDYSRFDPFIHPPGTKVMPANKTPATRHASHESARPRNSCHKQVLHGCFAPEKQNPARQQCFWKQTGFPCHNV